MEKRDPEQGTKNRDILSVGGEEMFAFFLGSMFISPNIVGGRKNPCELRVVEYLNNNSKLVCESGGF